MRIASARQLMLAIGVFLGMAQGLIAQPTFDYGSSWINPAQTYIKLLAAEDAIYRATAADLSAAGFSVSPAQVPNLQLWYRGVQQHIHVETSGGNLSYIEFAGLRNDGKIDSTLYRDNLTNFIHRGDIQPIERLSLYSDTSAYFLTVGNTPGLRAITFNDQSYGNYTPEPTYRYEVYHEYHPNNAAGWSSGGGGQYDVYNSLNSYFVVGEGYIGLDFGYNDPLYQTINIPQAANIGTPTEFRCRIFGRSSRDHVLEVTLDGNTILQDSTSGIYIKTRTTTFTLPLNPVISMVYNAYGTAGGNTDNNNYCWSSFRYDRLPDLEGLTHTKIVDQQLGLNTYYRFTNTGPATSVVAWDLYNKTRSLGSGDGTSVMNVVIAGSNSKRNILVAGDPSIRTPIIQQPQLSNLSNPANGAEFLIITHPSLLASANAYKTYRDTCTVNQLNAKVVTVHEIYDEFGYGSTLPLAIKRFIKYTLDNWTTKPKYVLLWGKGMIETRNKPLNLVPTFSDPPNDQDFVSEFDNFAINPVPLIPIGRVNVYNDQEGYIYLDKVKDYEHTPWAEWMKHTVFLGGGNNVGEQTSIRDYLRDDYRIDWQGPPIGGTANYYQKYHNGLETNSNVSSTQRINEGASIIHFFGHSSSNLYDVDIQEPVLYQNFGKHPLMIAFGCYGGNFTNPTTSFGERFVLQADRGSIGYLANSTAGYLLPLGDYGSSFYASYTGSQYGKPIGDIHKETIRHYYSRNPDLNYINHAKQVNLQGDPSITIHSPEKPDLKIAESDIFFTPQSFSASDSFFTLNVVVHNLARATQDSFLLSVRQLTPNGTWITYPSIKHPPINSMDTIPVLIQNRLGMAMSGMNTFDVFADSTNLLDEYDESNNRVLHNVVIPGNTPAIVSPTDFAIVPGQVKLVASAYVMNNQPVVRYQFEIDTVPEFNSPLKEVSPVVSGTAAYAEWTPSLVLGDSAVYYWRVRLADHYPASWAKASFKHIPARTGWAQSRPPQFFTDPVEHISMNQTDRRWAFDPYSVELAAYVMDFAHGVYRLANGAFSSDQPSLTSYNGFLYTPIRAIDLIPTVQNTSFGDWNYQAMPDAASGFTSMLSTVPTGDYILLVSEGNPRVNQWPANLTNALQAQGVDMASLLNRPDGSGFVIFIRKGHPGSTIQIDRPNVFDNQQGNYRYDLRVALTTSQPEGNIQSTTIGPATDWQSLYWGWSSPEALNGDDIRVSLYASRNGANDSLVFDHLSAGTHNLSAIDAARYPYLRLKAWAKDSVRRSAPQLEHWHVVYTPAPDVAIEPAIDWAFQHDTLTNNQAGSVDFSAHNISDLPMDSLLVKFGIRRADRTRIELGTRRYAPIAPGQTLQLHYDFSVPANNITGNVLFTIELNPDGDQPEVHHFNNLYEHRFFVSEDNIQPLLDVTFDGKHLMNGDIVSPNAEILIEVNDENPFLAVNDTSFEIHFGPKNPNPNSLPRIFVGGNSQMESVPATLPANKARLYYRPGRLDDGDYTLRVQGYDYAGNPSGKTAYEVNFKVVNESALSNVLNYPNPFSTSTRFVYTLTGSQIPETFEVHIFTITGRLVKVIDLHETNDVRVGYNMTDYAWDGRDEFGDLLANGVYIYKIVAKAGGQTMKLRDEGVTELFNNGFGKMYIMR